MIFTREQAALVRAGKITGAIIPATKPAPKPNSVVPLWRRHTRHNEDGVPVGVTSEIVYDHQSDHPDQPVRLTIQAVYKNVRVDQLDQVTAHACGYKTAQGLQDAWRTSHPRTRNVHIIRFSVGDLRDQGRWIGWTGRAGGDYTTNPRRAADDAEALQVADLSRLAKQNNERYLVDRKDKIVSGRDDLVRGLEKLELEGASSPGVAAAIRSIRKQIAVLDRRLKAA